MCWNGTGPCTISYFGTELCNGVTAAIASGSAPLTPNSCVCRRRPIITAPARLTGPTISIMETTATVAVIVTVTVTVTDDR